MTVSRVINDHPAVRPKTKKKVQAAIEELGYERNEAAGMLKGQRAMMIGLIVPDLSDIFFATCANTVEQLDVTPGVGVADAVEVRGALADGDRLVVRGAERLAAGQAVRVIATEPPARPLNPG